MSNPYLIEGPAQISFSGGRSSGMMLCKIVEAHGGTLPDDVIVAFANTGKEREETLQFVARVADHLGVRVHWLEYKVDGKGMYERWREVCFSTAARNGEPFSTMIRKERYLPNPIARNCTQLLKIKPQQALMHSLGFGKTLYTTIAGIRADEPGRAAKMRAREDIEFVLPLAEAGVQRSDVQAFWRAMPFDLALPTINGETVGGNCDLCYLKGVQKIIGLIRENPRSADWWIEQETYAANNFPVKPPKVQFSFRFDRPNYAALKIIALQPQLDFGEVTEDALPCECVD